MFHQNSRRDYLMMSEMRIWPVRTKRLGRQANKEHIEEMRRIIKLDYQLQVDDRIFSLKLDEKTMPYFVDNHTVVVAIVKIGEGTYPIGYQLHLMVYLTNVDVLGYGESELALAVIPLEVDEGTRDPAWELAVIRPDEASKLLEKLEGHLLMTRGLRGSR
jgi:hypothetical protein